MTHRTTNEWVTIALDDKRPDERRKAVEQLARGRDVRDDGVVRTFDTIARTDADAMVRVAAVRGLSIPADSRTVATLLKLLSSSAEHPVSDCKPSDGPVRWEAAIVLERLGTSNFIPASELEAALAAWLDRARHDTDRNVRLVASTALGSFKDRRVPPVLVENLRANDYALQRRAQDSLRRLTGQSFDADADAWSAWLTAHSSDMFAQALPPAAPKTRAWWEKLVSRK